MANLRVGLVGCGNISGIYLKNAPCFGHVEIAACADLDLERAKPPASQRLRILYLTQAGIAPPTFVLFTDRAHKLHFSVERFLENQFRRAFDFAGTPIVLRTKPRRGL